MAELAIIGGTGITSFPGLKIERKRAVHTPYGEPSGPVTYGHYCDTTVIFLPRHGYGHHIPPHQINYRANLWSLHHLEVKRVLAFAAVGAIHPDMQPGDLVIPHQLIDYTWGRSHTFFEQGAGDKDQPVVHIDFTQPYCGTLREHLLQAARQTSLRVHQQGVYAATQGPRLETAAEIDRLERDGCDLVGMTGMPEAALARELGICYATCAIIANAAAGRGAPSISMEEIDSNMQIGVENARTLLAELLALI